MESVNLLRVRFAGVITLLYIFSMPALANDDLVVIKVKLDQVMEPKSVIDTTIGCVKNSACKAILDAAAAYVGVNISSITSAAALIDQKKTGEEGNFSYKLPNGYQYCRAKVETVSVVPAEGDRASLMNVRGSAQGVGVYTWTPVLPVGQGRSWVEADFTIVGVRDGLADQYRKTGQCKAKYITADCRGAKGVNKGLPACGVITD